MPGCSTVCAWDLWQVVQKFYSEFTGQSVERIEQLTDRDNFMSPKEAAELGLIDAVL